MDDTELARVIPLEPARRGPSRRPGALPLSAVALVVAAALAISPLASGYYAFTVWGPLALGAIVLLVFAALAARGAAFTRFGLTAAGALAALLALSAASIMWAESKDSAWTDSNRLALYLVIFAIGALVVRERRSARTIMLVLGAPALLTSIALATSLIGGSAQGAFLTGRLNSPIGYINGTAGLLVMGIWPWVALAETAGSRLARVGALAGAALIGNIAVLTQSRAIVPAMLIATLFVLAAAPGRVKRAFNLLIVAAGVGLGLHWTLAVYPASGPLQTLQIGTGVLRSAGLAIVAGSLLAGVLKFSASVVAHRLEPAALTGVTRVMGRTLVAGTVAAVVVGTILGGHWISRQYDSFTQLKVDQAAPNRFLDAGGFRYDLWRVAIDDFRDHPFGGLGAGNYDVSYYRLRHNPEYVVQPHSLELQMGAELGIGGLLALLLFCGAVLAAGLARKGTLAAREPTVRLAALGMFVAWLAATSVDWLYDIPGLAGMAFLAGAVLVVPDSGQNNSVADPVAGPRSRGRSGQVILVVALGALALLAASIGRQYAATRYARSGAGKLASSPRAALSSLQQAESLDPYSLGTLYSIAGAYARIDDYPDARAALLAAQQREPHNYVPPALLGDLATRKGDYRLALDAYTKALSLNPLDPSLQSAVVQARARVP